MSSEVLNHSNCLITVFPDELKAIAKCKDKATLERMKNASFLVENITIEGLLITAQCTSQEEYDFMLAQIALAKNFLEISEPEKMGQFKK